MGQSAVRDIMSTELVTVDPDATVTDAARLMVDSGVGALPVMENGMMIGIVSEGDLIMQDVKLQYPSYLHLIDGFIMYPASTQRFENELKKAVAADVRSVMTAKPVTIPPDATIEDAATLLVDGEVSRLPVLDGDRLVGIVSKSDIVRSLLAKE